MRKIAIINQKGGSGKTTTTVNVAAGLGAQDRSILIIDLDPQASTTAWLDCISHEKGLLLVMTENVDINTVIKQTSVPNVSLIPASSWLISLEKVLASEVGAETILKNKLEDLKQCYDYILIDCPPTLGILTINVLAACQEVIVPVEAHIMAVSGLVQLLQTIDVVKRRLNPDLKIAGIVACRLDSRTRHAREVVRDLREKFDDLVYKTAIRENVRLAEAPSFCKTIFDYAATSYGAEDYALLAKEIIQQERTYPVQQGAVKEKRVAHG